MSNNGGCQAALRKLLGLDFDTVMRVLANDQNSFEIKVT